MSVYERSVPEVIIDWAFAILLSFCTLAIVVFVCAIMIAILLDYFRR